MLLKIGVLAVPIGVAIWNIACKLEAAREAMNQDS
jgi:hypothetical protein